MAFSSFSVLGPTMKGLAPPTSVREVWPLYRSPQCLSWGGLCDRGPGVSMKGLDSILHCRTKRSILPLLENPFSETPASGEWEAFYLREDTRQVTVDKVILPKVKEIIRYGTNSGEKNDCQHELHDTSLRTKQSVDSTTCHASVTEAFLEIDLVATCWVTIKCLPSKFLKSSKCHC